MKLNPVSLIHEINVYACVRAHARLSVCACTNPENSIRVGTDKVLILVLVINVFHRGPYKPLLRRNSTESVQLLFIV